MTRFRRGITAVFNAFVRGELVNSEPRNLAVKKLSYGVDTVIDDYFLLSQSTRLTNLDRETDKKAIIARSNRVRCELKCNI